jgi:hypothetical protein
MSIQISISNAIKGYRSVPGGVPVDPDAQAFITAAGITDPTQQAAINTLVVNLKGYSIWTKMEALYPMVGGTSSTHKFNLKNPLDTDGAFRMTFHGGVTHSSNGITFATNGYADTKWLPSANSTTSNVSGGVYSRTNSTADYALLGSLSSGFTGLLISPKTASGITYYGANNYIVDGSGNFVTDTRGLFHVNRDSSTVSRLYRNGGSIGNTTPTVSNAPAFAVYLGSRNNQGTAESYFNGTLAFAFLGDTLNSTESANLYTSVQAFQTALGRSIGTQIVSDADAQAFINAANIQDQVEANAINNLVIGMKANGTWTKMKAIYPFVGGTSSTHKWNLKDPRDLDVAFRLVFNGGWTHSSTGLTPNGVNGWADTKLIAQGTLGLNSTHVSVYSRTNSDVLAPSIGNITGGASAEVSMWLRTGGVAALRVNNGSSSTIASTDSRGLFIGNRNSSTQINLSIRGTQTTFNQNSNSLSTNVMQLGGVNPNFFDTKQLAFASIGDGLTAQNMTDLTTDVNAFQTALNRNV